MNDKENVLSHALAGQFMGNKLIYFDCGSGSKFSIKSDLLSYISKEVKIPIIVGGGVKSYNEAINYLVAELHVLLLGIR